ncbi:MAG: homoserine dehydrogenase [Desulfobacterales bacterium]|nr:homoserine dehydrogenase [Desulfobacterales bacterium]
MKRISIGLLGCGTVGVGVAKLLLENQALIQSRLGANLYLKHIADIDTTTDRGIAFGEGVLVNDAFAVVADPDIDIVVEMIGGEGIAKELILKAMENGKHVVTANKALMAAQGNLLVEKARAANVDLAYEASVGGCMPIIKSLREALVGNHIRSMTGILNGTCNYILSRITDEGSEFATVLTEAQAQGYAEADPTLDVGGHDAAHKLAIITALAFGMEINLADTYTEGISKITPMDIEFARQFGYRIKLLAIAKNDNEKIEARVHPTMIPEDNQLSKINGTLNAVMVSGDAIGDVLLCGHGAGQMPTASAGISDLVDIARNIMAGIARRIPGLSYQPEHIGNIPIMPMDELFTYYYLRLGALDKPGVLSIISGVLGEHGIGIKSVQQKGRRTAGAVPIVMLTHRARELDIKNAVAEITALDVVEDEPMVIRIEDENHQV